MPEVGLCLAPGLDLIDHGDLLDPFEEDLNWDRAVLVMSVTRAQDRAVSGAGGAGKAGSPVAPPAAAYLERYGFLQDRAACFAATAELNLS